MILNHSDSHRNINSRQENECPNMSSSRSRSYKDFSGNKYSTPKSSNKSLKQLIQSDFNRPLRQRNPEIYEDQIIIKEISENTESDDKSGISVKNNNIQALTPSSSSSSIFKLPFADEVMRLNYSQLTKLLNSHTKE